MADSQKEFRRISNVRSGVEAIGPYQKQPMNNECTKTFKNFKYSMNGKEVLHLQYFYNIFTNNHKWLVIIGYNLNLSMKLFFCPTNNNL